MLPRLQVLRHSRLYESAAAYVTDQPPFLNAALAVRTELSPPELLTAIKQIEVQVHSEGQLRSSQSEALTRDSMAYLPIITHQGGSDKNIKDAIGIAVAALQTSAGRDFQGKRWGPRPLDLDIIFHGSASLVTERLQVPHARWQERDFVKAPLADLYTAAELASLEDAVASNLRASMALWKDAGGALFTQCALSSGSKASHHNLATCTVVSHKQLPARADSQFLQVLH